MTVMAKMMKVRGPLIGINLPICQQFVHALVKEVHRLIFHHCRVVVPLVAYHHNVDYNSDHGRASTQTNHHFQNL